MKKGESDSPRGVNFGAKICFRKQNLLPGKQISQIHLSIALACSCLRSWPYFVLLNELV